MGSVVFGFLESQQAWNEVNTQINRGFLPSWPQAARIRIQPSQPTVVAYLKVPNDKSESVNYSSGPVLKKKKRKYNGLTGRQKLSRPDFPFRSSLKHRNTDPRNRYL